MLQKVEMQFQIEFDDAKKAEIVIKALKPEMLTSPSQRASVKLDLTGRKLDVDIQADDVTSLRAVINSYLRWIMLSMDVIDIERF
ncbi:MAG TPA: KEOPS complex subunit Pcc1 [Methanobacterium sp.]|nr:KEOPS complex subunit Pcc1 [Methanobacterium sp.]